MKKTLIPCAALTLVLLLSACGSSTLELPDLSGLGEITVIAREEGSGTRSEFESLLDTLEEGATATALSTEDVVSMVALEENAIGYVAYSSLDASSGVTALAVDGVEPSQDTIADGSYPLCRQYLLAYSGDLSDLETDFIRYIRSAGQAIVAETCTPVKDVTTFLSDQSSGTILISGSSSVAPLMEELAADYLTYNPNAEIEIEVTDSTEGLNAAMRGDCDLAMSSRSLKDYEAELLETKVIAADGVAVIVNSSSPLTELTSEMITAIYDGEITVWSDLNS